MQGEFGDGRTVPLPGDFATYSSSDPSVAIVSDRGQVFGLAPGVSTIYVTAGGLSAATAVTVGDALDAGRLDFYPDTYALTPGETREFFVRQRIGNDPVQRRSSQSEGVTYVPFQKN